MRTLALVLLGLLAGFASGVLVGRHWARQLEWQGRRAMESIARRVAEPPPEQRHRDSLMMSSFSRESHRLAREIRRMEAFGNCVITYEVQDTSWKNLQLMNVRAQFEEGQRCGRAGDMMKPATTRGRL